MTVTNVNNEENLPLARNPNPTQGVNPTDRQVQQLPQVQQLNQAPLSAPVAVASNRNSEELTSGLKRLASMLCCWLMSLLLVPCTMVLFPERISEFIVFIIPELEMMSEKSFSYFDNTDLRKKLLILRAAIDHNGVFIPKINVELYQSFDNFFDIRYRQVGTVNEICEEIRYSGNNLTGLLLLAHGNGTTIQLDSASYWNIGDLLPHDCFTELNPNATIVLNSCSTASDSVSPNFAEYIAAMSRREVIAPSEDVYGGCVYDRSDSERFSIDFRKRPAAFQFFRGLFLGQTPISESIAKRVLPNEAKEVMAAQNPNSWGQTSILDNRAQRVLPNEAEEIMAACTPPLGYSIDVYQVYVQSRILRLSGNILCQIGKEFSRSEELDLKFLGRTIKRLGGYATAIGELPETAVGKLPNSVQKVIAPISLVADKVFLSLTLCSLATSCSTSPSILNTSSLVLVIGSVLERAGKALVEQGESYTHSTFRPVQIISSAIQKIGSIMQTIGQLPGKAIVNTCSTLASYAGRWWMKTKVA